MTILTKPINEITYQDVINFCETGQMPEGVHLDYKADFPPENEKLAKTIAAFANTWGGTLLIGVDESDGNPKPPFKGIPYRDKLYERIEDIIFGNIRPPVFCEIQVAHNTDKSKAFIVIRIPQSNDGHILNKDGATYIRTGRSSRPEEVASPEQIEWLMDRRKKSVELKKSIYRKAEERFSNFCRLHSINDKELKGLCSLSIIPLYPQKPLKEYREIPEIAKKIEVYSNYFSYNYPDNVSSGGPQKVQGGVSHFAKTEHDLEHFWELNHFGLFVHKEKVVWEKTESDSRGEKIKSYIIEEQRIVSLICLFLKVALNLYKQLSYWGLLEFQLQIKNIFGFVLPVKLSYVSQRVIDNELSWTKEFSLKELEDNFKDITIKILHNVFWSVGVEKKEEKIEDLIKQIEPSIAKKV